MKRIRYTILMMALFMTVFSMAVAVTNMVNDRWYFIWLTVCELAIFGIGAMTSHRIFQFLSEWIREMLLYFMDPTPRVHSIEIDDQNGISKMIITLKSGARYELRYQRHEVEKYESDPVLFALINEKRWTLLTN